LERQLSGAQRLGVFAPNAWTLCELRVRSVYLRRAPRERGKSSPLFFRAALHLNPALDP